MGSGNALPARTPRSPSPPLGLTKEWCPPRKGRAPARNGIRAPPRRSSVRRTGASRLARALDFRAALQGITHQRAAEPDPPPVVLRRIEADRPRHLDYIRSRINPRPPATGLPFERGAVPFQSAFRTSHPREILQLRKRYPRVCSLIDAMPYHPRLVGLRGRSVNLVGGLPQTGHGKKLVSPGSRGNQYGCQSARQRHGRPRRAPTGHGGGRAPRPSVATSACAHQTRTYRTNRRWRAG
jgi:hypothetical protein